MIKNNSSTSRVLRLKYRADIDGLRAIAVFSVVCFHAFPDWLEGGFMGVDVFFVISGYLISIIVFESLEENRFSFNDFYGRRIRRIFPALILVLLFCYVFGWFTLLADEYQQLGKHMAAGATFLSNFILWRESGYFDTAAETKPLLHLWSLGIEEQFYIIWPPLLWLAFKQRIKLIYVVLSLGVISFVFNICSISFNSIAAFYSPQTRFWELIIGSLLSLIFLKKYCVKFFEPYNTLLSVSGLILVFISFIFLSKRSVPGYCALLPTIGTALLLLTRDSWINRKILACQLMVWLGLISFPLYLWHWPLLSFGHILKGDELTTLMKFGLVLLSVVLAMITYQFIEKPIRSPVQNKFKTIALGLFMIIIAFLGFNLYLREGLEFRYKKLILDPQVF